jgi:hypothetical protein
VEDFAQRPVQIELDGLRPVFYALRIRDKLARVMFQLLQPDAVFVDFGFDVSVGGAGKRHCDRAGAAVPRQANHANVVGEVFAAKLCADAELAAGFEQRRFQRRIAKRLAQFVSAGGQIVVIFCRSQLRHLQRLVRRQAPTKAMWYGGQAAVPSAFIFSIRKAVSFSGCRIDFVS